MDGRGLLAFPQGGFAIGRFDRGLVEGRVRVVLANGDELLGECCGGIFEGIFLRTFARRQRIVECLYEHGVIKIVLRDLSEEQFKLQIENHFSEFLNLRNFFGFSSSCLLKIKTNEDQDNLEILQFNGNDLDSNLLFFGQTKMKQPNGLGIIISQSNVVSSVSSRVISRGMFQTVISDSRNCTSTFNQSKLFQLNGHGRISFSNGDFIEGQFESGQLNGRGFQYNNYDKVLLHGYFLNNSLHTLFYQQKTEFPSTNAADIIDLPGSSAAIKETIECRAFLFAEEEALFFVMSLHSLGSFTAEQTLSNSISSLLKKSLIKLNCKEDELQCQKHQTTQVQELQKCPQSHESASKKQQEIISEKINFNKILCETKTKNMKFSFVEEEEKHQEVYEKEHIIENQYQNTQKNIISRYSLDKMQENITRDCENMKYSNDRIKDMLRGQIHCQELSNEKGFGGQGDYIDEEFKYAGDIKQEKQPWIDQKLDKDRQKTELQVRFEKEEITLQDKEKHVVQKLHFQEDTDRAEFQQQLMLTQTISSITPKSTLQTFNSNQFLQNVVMKQPNNNNFSNELVSLMPQKTLQTTFSASALMSSEEEDILKYRVSVLQDMKKNNCRIRSIRNIRKDQYINHRNENDFELFFAGKKQRNQQHNTKVIKFDLVSDGKNHSQEQYQKDIHNCGTYSGDQNVDEGCKNGQELKGKITSSLSQQQQQEIGYLQQGNSRVEVKQLNTKRIDEKIDYNQNTLKPKNIINPNNQFLCFSAKTDKIHRIKNKQESRESSVDTPQSRQSQYSSSSAINENQCRYYFPQKSSIKCLKEKTNKYELEQSRFYPISAKNYLQQNKVQDYQGYNQQRNMSTPLIECQELQRNYGKTDKLQGNLSMQNCLPFLETAKGSGLIDSNMTKHLKSILKQQFPEDNCLFLKVQDLKQKMTQRYVNEYQTNNNKKSMSVKNQDSQGKNIISSIFYGPNIERYGESQEQIGISRRK